MSTQVLSWIKDYGTTAGRDMTTHRRLHPSSALAKTCVVARSTWRPDIIHRLRRWRHQDFSVYGKTSNELLKYSIPSLALITLITTINITLVNLFPSSFQECILLHIRVIVSLTLCFSIYCACNFKHHWGINRHSDFVHNSIASLVWNTYNLLINPVWNKYIAVLPSCLGVDCCGSNARVTHYDPWNSYTAVKK